MQANNRRARQRGSLAARPNAKGGETWIAKFYVADERVTRTLGPKRSPRTKANPHPVGLTEAEAEAKLVALKREMEEAAKSAPKPTPTRTARKVWTLREVGDSLMDEMRKKGRRPATLEGMGSVLRIHVVPFFGPTPVGEVDKSYVEKFVAALERKRLAPKTIRNVLVNLHAVFEHAIGEGWSNAANPVARVPKPDKVMADGDLRFLELEEVEALLRAIPDGELARVDRAMYVTAAMTGLRQGELFGLRWRDVDWRARKIRVQQSFVRGQFQSPKSKKPRTVPLSDRVAAELELLFQHSVRQGDDDLVFAHPVTGTVLDRSKVSARFKTAATRARIGAFETVIDRKTGRPKLDADGKPVERAVIRFHDLRHTFATTMARGGNATMQDIQAWMGHADLKTTLIYGHYKPSHREAEWVEQAFAADALAEVESAVGAGPVPDRIRELNALHADGLISAEELATHRERLLSALSAA